MKPFDEVNKSSITEEVLFFCDVFFFFPKSVFLSFEKKHTGCVSHRHRFRSPTSPF